jgi:hypothetical protein
MRTLSTILAVTQTVQPHSHGKQKDSLDSNPLFNSGLSSRCLDVTAGSCMLDDQRLPRRNSKNQLELTELKEPFRTSSRRTDEGTKKRKNDRK